jgi:hypothetical protein
MALPIGERHCSPGRENRDGAAFPREQPRRRASVRILIGDAGNAVAASIAGIEIVDANAPNIT